MMDFETRAIHDGQEPDPATGAITTPIYQTSTFVQDAVGEHKGYDYARVANPTRTALQVALASLENADHGVAFSSGLGATTTLMHLVNPGERVVLIADVYGGVYRMTSQVYEPKGYVFDYIEAPEFANLADHLDERTRMVWIETPVEPAAERRRHPRRRRGGESGRRDPGRRQHVRDPVPPEPARPRRRRRRALDDEVPGRPLRRRRRLRRDERPDDRRAPLLPPEVARRRARPLRLVARPARAEDARACGCSVTPRTRARSPAGSRTQPTVTRVLYPGLPEHPGHEIAKRQMRDFGGMISFLTETEDEAVELVARTKLFRLAESLGGVESLIEHPARMTHASTADAPFAAPRNLVRLSVGIESVDDLIADLAAALVPARANASSRICLISGIA